MTKPILDVHVLTTVESMLALEGEWDTLAQASGAPIVALPMWQMAWWRQFHHGRALSMVTVRDGGDLIGLVPCLRRVVWHRRVVPVRRLEWLCTGEDEADEICSDYVGPLAAPGREDDVVRAFVAGVRRGLLGGWDEASFVQMDGASGWPERMVRACDEFGIEAESVETSRCPYIALPETWDAYVAGLSSDDRYVVNRSLRELDKWSKPEGYTIERAVDAPSLARGKELLYTLHGERWTGAGGHSLFDSARFRAFHDDVMPTALARGQLDLRWLLVRGEPVCVLYNFIHQGKLSFYQSGRRTDLPKQVKIGVAMHALGIRDAITKKLREYDLLAGESQYKKQLATTSRPLTAVYARAPGARAGAVRLAQRGLERAVQKVKEHRG